MSYINLRIYGQKARHDKYVKINWVVQTLLSPDIESWNQTPASGMEGRSAYL